jgi:translocation and assembly module TamA
VCSGPAFAADAVQVRIDGAGDLRRLLEEQLDIVRRRSEEGLSPDEIERLFAATPGQIRELLATEGYFSPLIRPEFDRNAAPPVARFTVDPGRRTVVTQVDIRFKGAIAEGPHADPRRMERLRRRWPLDPGEAFRQADWSAAKSGLLKGLLTEDYPAAAITDSEARIDPAVAAATLTVEVDSGPFFTFGELEVHGLERYTRDIVDALNPIHPGDAYSQEKLNELQARLDDTGYFRSTFAAADVDPAHPERVPVRVDVVENQRRRLGLGIGFSTDSGARLQVKWLDRNFLNRNWRLESELRFDRLTRLAGGDVYLQPLANGWLPSFGARFERTLNGLEQDDKLRTGLRIASPNKLDEKAWALTYYADRERIGDAYLNNRQALVASFSYTKRRLDHPLTPRRGYLASIDLGVGASGVLNEHNLLRAVARATWLTPFVQRWHGVLRGQVGQVFGAGRESVPEDLLFRTGGDQSVRGYGYNTLGPTLNGVVVGGTVSAVVSAELIYQFTPQWGGAVFTDAGNAADSWREFRFKRGSGIGARWQSPIGPVNLDFAYGHAIHQPRLHFSIGYGF